MAKRSAISSTDDMSVSPGEELVSLYDIIPCFLRIKLGKDIDSELLTPQLKALECDQPGYQETASDFYNSVLQKMDEFLKNTMNRDDEITMHFSKLLIQKRFKDKQGDFLKVMVNCSDIEQASKFMREMTGNPLREQRRDRPESQKNEPNESETRLQEIELCLQNTKDLVRINNESPVQDVEVNTTQENLTKFLEDCINQTNSVQDMSALSDVFPVEDVDHNFKQTLEKSVENLEDLSNRCLAYIQECLVPGMDSWKTDQILGSVGLSPRSGLDSVHLQRCSRFAAVLNTLITWLQPTGSSTHLEAGLLDRTRLFEKNQQDVMCELPTKTGQVQANLEKIQKIYIENFVIVSEQPPEIVSVENKSKNSGKESAAEDENKTAEDKKKVYNSKEKKGAFSTQISLPGGENFTVFSFNCDRIEYVTEMDLAQGNQPGLSTSTKTVGKKTGGKSTAKKNAGKEAKTAEPPVGYLTHDKPVLTEKPYGILFKNIRFCNYTRQEGTTTEEFVRIRYHLRVGTACSEYNFQVLSLPFHINTGSIQLLAMLGARMWYFYCMASPQLYRGDYTIPGELPVMEVLKMLDLRIRHVHPKGRHLVKKEMDYLQTRMKVRNDKVFLEDFVKNERPRPNENTQISFFGWFHAVANTIKDLVQPWLDGLIFGVIGQEDAHKVLSLSKYLPGDFLLRPSRFYLAKPSTVRPLAALVMNVKVVFVDPDTGSQSVEVKDIPIQYEDLEKYSLYETITGQEYNKEPLAKHIVGHNMRKAQVSKLKDYNQKSKSSRDCEYKVIWDIKRVANVTFLSASSPDFQTPENPPSPKKSSSKGRKKASVTKAVHASRPSMYDDSNPLSQTSFQAAHDSMEESGLSPSQSQAHKSPSGSGPQSQASVPSKQMEIIEDFHTNTTVSRSMLHKCVGFTKENISPAKSPASQSPFLSPTRPSFSDPIHHIGLTQNAPGFTSSASYPFHAASLSAQAIELEMAGSRNVECESPGSMTSSSPLQLGAHSPENVLSTQCWDQGSSLRHTIPTVVSEAQFSTHQQTTRRTAKGKQPPAKHEEHQQQFSVTVQPQGLWSGQNEQVGNPLQLFALGNPNASRNEGITYQHFATPPSHVGGQGHLNNEGSLIAWGEGQNTTDCFLHGNNRPEQIQVPLQEMAEINSYPSEFGVDQLDSGFFLSM